MSHFAILVIGPDVEKQLQPYHEFECTGADDEHVQDIDQTAEKLAEFKASTQSMVKAPDGTLLSRHDDAFYREPTDQELKDMAPLIGTGWSAGVFYTSKDWGDGRGHRAKIHHIPEGYEEVAVPFESFAAWCEYHDQNVVPFGEQPDLAEKHKYSYVTVDEAGNPLKFVRRTNPNKKWDWWAEGGRWSGFLKLKDGVTLSAQRDEGGVYVGPKTVRGGRADQAMKGAIDFDGMRDEAGSKASAKWEKARAALVAAGAPLTWSTWEHIRDVVHKGSIDVARDAYHAQPSVKALKEAFKDDFFLEPDQFLVPQEVYTQQARDRATVLYAFVKDGQWVGKGEMGWFGTSSGDEDQDTWNRKVNELLDSLPDDTLITVVDCHI